jgi:hypothetical protein
LEVVGEKQKQPVERYDGQSDGQAGTAAVAIAGDAQRQEGVGRHGLDRHEADQEDTAERECSQGRGR